MSTAKQILERIESYLINGGLFNPEMMESDKVRDLIIDCREYITSTPAQFHTKSGTPVSGYSKTP